MISGTWQKLTRPPRARSGLMGIVAFVWCFALSAPVPATSAKKPSRYAAGAMPASARQYYQATWGVDQLTVKLAESGQLVRFSYRVVDAAKAQALEDKASSPSMVDHMAHVALSVPVMDKVGALRQTMPAENNKTYWMLFSNNGSKVRSGHRVSVEIGPVRIDGLIVQ
jgi:hypothetical protein